MTGNASIDAALILLAGVGVCGAYFLYMILCAKLIPSRVVSLAMVMLPMLVLVWFALRQELLSA